MITSLIKTKIDIEPFLMVTRNTYKVVSARLYSDKKGKLPEGYNLILQIIYDDNDYGLDKNGEPIENNLFQNFDATILTRKHQIKKGDTIRLIDFDDEHSYLINYNLILRFRDCEVINQQAQVKQNEKN